MVLPYQIQEDAFSVWLSAYNHHPTLFYACQWTGAVHNDLVNGSVQHCLSPAALHCKGLALRLLGEELADAQKKGCNELTIIAIGLLGTHELNEEAMQRMKDATPLLLHSLRASPAIARICGRLSVDPVHFRMIHDIVERLGGLKAIKTPGLVGIVT
jgi:hypothetical protein